MAGLLLYCLASAGSAAPASVESPAIEPSITPPSLIPTSDYFTIRPDLRKCASPKCGGFWITKVNLALQNCPDGSTARSCYVWDINVPAGTKKQAIANNRVLTHGQYAKDTLQPSPVPYYRLDIDAAYAPILLPSAESRWGVYTLARHNDIVCITTPCPNIDIAPLNLKQTTTVANLQFSPRFSAQQVEEIQAGVATEGFITLGHGLPVVRPDGQTWAVSNAYRLLTADTTNVCGGLQGQVCGSGEYCNFGPHCGASDQTGVCEKVPEVCTDQYDPVCGCDGRTYSNTCDAAANSVSVVHKGACK
ncbi:MAG TPA: Kazal-type serine protease inhibitor family protein [Dongiaceae bacterium]|nr:Kazal-type serine protease inhibitor family protein [Dongiaceae bacterium]